MHIWHRKLAGFQESPSCRESTWILGCFKFMLIGHLSLLSSQRHPQAKLLGRPYASQVSALVYQSPCVVSPPCTPPLLFVYSELFRCCHFSMLYLLHRTSQYPGSIFTPGPSGIRLSSLEFLSLIPSLTCCFKWHHMKTCWGSPILPHVFLLNNVSLQMQFYDGCLAPTHEFHAS